MFTFSPSLSLNIGKGKDSKALDDRPAETKPEAVVPAVAPAAPSPAQRVVLRMDDFQFLVVVLLALACIVIFAAHVHELRA